VFVAGLPLIHDDVLELARLVEPDLAEKLYAAVDRSQTVLALTVPEREQILRSLEDCPPTLAQLRGVLLREHEWRLEHGLNPLEDAGA
jgi:hypothetical protein